MESKIFENIKQKIKKMHYASSRNCKKNQAEKMQIVCATREQILKTIKTKKQQFNQ